MLIAKIAVSAATFSMDKPYSYRFGGDMALEPGMRVMVPFGRGNRHSEGVVLAVCEGDERGLKAVEQQLDPERVLPEPMLRLAAFLRERYFCTFYEAIRTMLPAPLAFRTVVVYTLSPDAPWRGNCRDAAELAICRLLHDLGGRAEADALKGCVPNEDARNAALETLVRRKWITKDRDFLRRIGDKTESVATLAASAEEAMEFAARRPASARVQKAVLELLSSVGSASVRELSYHTGATKQTLKRLEALGYVNLSERSVLRCRQIMPTIPAQPLTLNAEQQCCFDGLSQQMGSEKPGVALLHGVTGSGKTSVYLKLIERCLADGKSAVLLVPEIALTPQLLGVLAGHFGDQVAVLHSSLGAGSAMTSGNG